MRAIGVRHLVASVLNVVIGAGIFVLPATVAANLGPAAPVAYLVCTVLMALIVLCFVAAGSRVSLTGGLYAYIEVAFGPFVGVVAGVLYGFVAALGVASVASAFAESAGALWSTAAGGAVRALVIAILFAVLAAINVRGVRLSARLISIVTICKLAPLVLLIVTGLWFVDPDNLRWTGAPSFSAVGQTAIVLGYAFGGVEVALVPSGEIQDPARTVPRAVLIALGLVTAIYLLVQEVAQGILGPSMATFATAPLAEAAGRVLGGTGRLLVLVGATVSMFGYVAGDMLGSPRALFALGRNGLLPQAFARVHPRFQTPHVAVAAYGLVVALIAISSSFTQLALLTNVAGLSLYLLCVAASYELQRRDVRMAGQPFVLPGGAAIPLAAALEIVWLLSQATWREFSIDGAVFAVALVLYFARRRAAVT